MRGGAGRGRKRENKDDVWGGFGGYMGMKISKLEDQFSEQAQAEIRKDGIFAGVKIFVNGWTNPTSDELKRIMMEHGGVYHHYYSSRTTTHIIASNLPDVKVRQLRGHELIVKPSWIVECLSQGRLVDYKPHLLFTHQSKQQPAISFQTIRNTNSSTASGGKSVETTSLHSNSAEDLKDDQAHVPAHETGTSDKPENTDPPQPTDPGPKTTFLSFERAVQPVLEEIGLPLSPQKRSETLAADSLTPRKLDKQPIKLIGGSPKAKDAADPAFLGEFFQNSRLHHISTMGANAKAYVAELREKHSGEFPGREDRLAALAGTDPDPESVFMHIDMDSFFVSVGLRKRPDLVGQPVAVTHARGNRPSKGLEEDRAVAESRRAELQQYKQRLAKRLVARGNQVLAPAEEEEEDTVSTRPFWKIENIDGLSSMSEVASCSYEARAAGVRNGMFLGPALQLCPNLVTIPYDFPVYEEVSRILYDTVASYTLDIQAVSCDEMFVDLSGLLRQFKMDAMQFITLLRQEIKDRTGCSCSVGLGPNILLARMATKKAKPNGQFRLRTSEAETVMTELKVTELPGVGRSLEARLSQMGVVTCGDLQRFTLGQLQGQLGQKTGAQLFNFARGRDSRTLELDHVRKTVSAEVNYGIRFIGWQDAEQFISQLATEVAGRLEKLETRGKCLTFKLMMRAENAPEQTAKFLGHGVCDNLSRSVQLAQPTRDQAVILREILGLVRQLRVKPADMRGIGISVSKLDEKRGAVSGNSSILKFVKKQQQPGPEIATLLHPAAGLTDEDRSRSPTEGWARTNGQAAHHGMGLDEGAAGPDRPPSAAREDPATRPQMTSIDPEFLAAMPQDIRSEILAQYGDGNVTTSAGPTNPPPMPVAGPSHHHHSKDGDKEKQQISDKLADLSFSQIDPGVLAELPADLQAEIRTHCQRPEEKKAQPAPIIVGSPTKLLVPKKGSVLKKRGRPKKNAAKTTRAPVASLSAHEKDGAACRPVTDSIDCAEESRLSSNSSSCPPAELGCRQERPTFCGKSSIEEIRPLLKEWLRSAETPLHEDVQMMANFLLGLVDCWRIDQVSVLLKCAHRNIEVQGLSASWRQAWRQLVAAVQAQMVATYGHPLHITETL